MARKILKILAAVVGGAVVLFGLTVFFTGEPSMYPYSIPFFVVGGLLLFLGLRQSQEDKARAAVRREAKAEAKKARAAQAAEDERRRQTQRQASQEEKQQRPSQWAAWKEARARRWADIREKQAQGVPCCPFCGCTSLSSQKRGYRVGKGVLWGVLLAAAGFWLGAFIGAGVGLALGLSFGSVGSGQVYCTCLSCGRRFRAGFRW